MSTFNQKSVIKGFKLRLQQKFNAVSAETENTISYLNNCLSEFKVKVQEILEIKDEKCLTLYRKLISDLENYSEKLFILQSSLEERADEDSDSSYDELPHSSDNSKSEEIKLLDNVKQRDAPSLPKEIEEFVTTSSSRVDIQPSCKNILKEAKQESLTYDKSSVADSSLFIPNDVNIQDHQSNHYTDIEDETVNCKSNQSFSQSSCYCSFSSSFCDLSDKKDQSCQFQSYESHKQSVSEIHTKDLFIRFPIINISSTFSATLSHITDPGNFWIQFENYDASNLRFLKSDYEPIKTFSFILEGTYCLAPLEESSIYCRAKSLSSAKFENENVKILFVDYGFVRDIPLVDLRPMPEAAFDIQAQAIHCFLYNTAPIKDKWSNECIERFKDFQNLCIETVVKSKKGDSYGVQLIAKLAADLVEDYSVDIAQCLWLESLALEKHESIGDNLVTEMGNVSNTVPNKRNTSNFSNVLSDTASSEYKVLSTDSGVSITSNKSSLIQHEPNQNSESKSFQESKLHKFINKQSCDKEISNDINQKTSGDLISFNSSDEVALFDDNPTNNFSLHFTITNPLLSFIQDNLMLVMVSHIENPQDFYVNMAMENIMTLDELREEMTLFYESSNANLLQINKEDIFENMFCAAKYNSDGYWYRIKILSTSKHYFSNNKVLVQYIDYGNSDVVDCSNLKPLSSQFSQHPCFSVKCYLVGIKPIEETNWSKEAVLTFKNFISFERCLTAEICAELYNSDDDTLPVFLWDQNTKLDTKESEDLLINLALVKCGVANIDDNLFELLTTKEKFRNLNDNNLDTWDPMTEEYHDIENSYAINTDDILVATTGYQAKDDEYTCKYFSLRGFCPRGDNCQYMHVTALESGITRDQEEVYCLDYIPTIHINMNILVQISAIISPTHFYVILPFGYKDVDEIDKLIYAGKTQEDILNTEAQALFYAMNKYYSNSPFQENTLIALSCGTIVAALRKWDKQWHRGRIVDVLDVDSPAKVFFVDAGDTEWVPRKFIRMILPQFLHTPFQAIQCSLASIEPISVEGNKTWSSEAINYFKECVSEEILLAEVIHRYGSSFDISLRKTRENDHLNIAQLLVSKGFAQYRPVVPSNRKETRYVPG